MHANKRESGSNLSLDYGTRFVWFHGHHAEEPEVEEGALAGLDEAGFVAIHEVEALGFIGQGFEGDGLAGGLLDADAAGVEVGVMARHFEVDRCGFNAPEPALPPFGHNDLFNEIGLDLIARLEAEEVSIEYLLEAFLGLISKKDSFGGEAVAQGIGGGDGARFRRLGTMAQGSVGTRGGDTA